jgi:outer membrane protein TolC
MDLSIKEAISLALENNLDIKIERLNPDIRKTETEKERAIFDPVFMADFSNAVSRTPAFSELQGAPKIEEKVFDFDFGVKQKFSTGAISELKFVNERVWSNSRFLTINPYYKSDLTLTVTQPLFKNFGTDVNLLRIRIAENNEKISRDQLKAKIIDIITNVKRAYWNLLLSIEELEVRRFSLNLAKDLLERNRKKFEVGIIAQIEIIEAEAGVASREEAVLVAEKAVKDAEDLLKRITGLTKDWEIVLAITDKPIISKEKKQLDESIKNALERRPDYLQAVKDLKNKEINMRFTKNQTLPNLSFVGGIGLNGLNSDYGSNLDKLKSGDFYSYQVGLSLEIPIGNRSAKNDYLKAKLEEEKARLTLKNLEEAITFEIREALREIDTTLKRIDASKVARILAEKKLEAEEKRFNVGMSTSHDILFFQEELASALRNEKKAMIDHNNSLINLEKVTGTAIEREGVVF